MTSVDYIDKYGNEASVTEFYKVMKDPSFMMKETNNNINDEIDSSKFDVLKEDTHPYVSSNGTSDAKSKQEVIEEQIALKEQQIKNYIKTIGGRVVNVKSQTISHRRYKRRLAKEKRRLQGKK